MSALEQEVLEKFWLLDEESQQRVRQQIAQKTSLGTTAIVIEPVESLDTWLEAATELREEFAATYGKLTFSVADLIREMREERLNDIMDRY